MATTMRRGFALGTMVVVLGATAGLLLARSERIVEQDAIRVVAAPARYPVAVITPVPVASPTPPEPAEAGNRYNSGVDPPAPREANAPNYADLGVLPAI
jgi:hypothetical protein